jgi:hypothetical protein
MPLEASVLSSALLALPPTTDSAAARRNHAAAFRTYMNGLVTVPPVLPIAHDAAEAAMAAALVGQELLPPSSIAAINAGYLAYVATILAALAASPGAPWIVAVPPSPQGPISPGVETSNITADSFADLVHFWVTQIRGSVPPVPPTNWF